MFARGSNEETIDRLAIGLSGLCLIHCVASAVFITFLAAGGSFLLDPIFHEVGMTIALVLGVFGFGRGIVRHGYMLPSAVGGLGLGVMAGALTLPHDGTEAMATILGVAILALGHRLNFIASE